MNSTARPRIAALSVEGLALDFDLDSDLAFVIRSFRLWLMGLRLNDPDCCSVVWNDFAGRLGSFDGKRALAALAGSIKAIQLHARRRIQHHPPCCRYLAPDEAAYLGLIAACQLKDAPLAQRRAEWLVRPSGRDELLGAGESLATVLQSQGVAIAARPAWDPCKKEPAAPDANRASKAVNETEAHGGQGLQ